MEKAKTAEEEKINLVEATEEAGGVVRAEPAQAPGADPGSPSSERTSDEGGKQEYVSRIVAERYEIVSLIGSGGMGKVFKAIDLARKSTVAIKLIPPERLKDPKALERFKHEAAVLSSLSHPSIVSLHEFKQEEDGSLYLVMDYVEGPTIADLLKNRGAMAPQKAIAVMRQVCEGLRQAHERGVAHRDLKPSNLILTEIDGQERVKILDFGLARAFDQSESSHIPLTETGEMLGTPWYMSPEQCFGQPTDARTDVYQLGCLFYELLTARKPFDGKTAFDVMFKHVTGTPGLEALSGDISAIVEKALKKNPAERYQSMEEMVSDLKLAYVNYADLEIQSREAGLYDDLIVGKGEELKSLLPRRLASEALDALIIGTILVVIVFCLDAAKLLYHYPLWDTWPLVFRDSVVSFFFALADSFLVWPAILFSLLPEKSFLPFTSLMPFWWTLIQGARVIPFALCLVNWLYHALFQSKLGATPGMIIFGLQLRGGLSQRPSFKKASLRHFARISSALFIPEIIRFFKNISKRSAGAQVAAQLRTPFHDQISKCADSVSVLPIRKQTAIVLSALFCLCTFLCLPAALTYMKQYDLALAVNAKFDLARHMRAAQNLEQGKFNEAIADLSAVQAVHPERQELYIRQAAAFYQLHQYDRASAVLQEGIKNVADHYEADYLRNDLARVLTSSGNYKRANDLIGEILLKTRGNKILAYFAAEKAGDELAAKTRLEAANDFYQEEKRWGDRKAASTLISRPLLYHAEATLNYAITENLLGRADSALACAEVAISECNRYLLDWGAEASPLREARYVRGAAFLLSGQLKETRQVREGTEDFKQAVKNFSDCIIDSTGTKNRVSDVQALARAYLGRARAYEKLGKTDLAARDFQSAQNLGLPADFPCDTESCD